jgi:hypothetical protein
LASEQQLEVIYDLLDQEIFFSKGGYVIPKRERAKIDATGGDATYGEVQAAGVDVLLRCVSSRRWLCLHTSMLLAVLQHVVAGGGGLACSLILPLSAASSSCTLRCAETQHC